MDTENTKRRRSGSSQLAPSVSYAASVGMRQSIARKSTPRMKIRRLIQKNRTIVAQRSKGNASASGKQAEDKTHPRSKSNASAKAKLAKDKAQPPKGEFEHKIDLSRSWGLWNSLYNAELTDAQVGCAELVMKAHNDTQVGWTPRADVSGRHARTLRDGGWLNDEIITAMADILAVGNPKIEIRHGLFFDHLTSEQYSYPSDKGLPKLQELDMIIMPLHTHNPQHWSVACADIRSRTIRHYCSISSEVDLHDIVNYLKTRARNGGSTMDEWNVVYVHDIPQQENGSDCGVFTTCYMYCLLMGRDMDFKQQDMPMLRSKIALAIGCSTLVNGLNRTNMNIWGSTLRTHDDNPGYIQDNGIGPVGRLLRQAFVNRGYRLIRRGTPRNGDCLFGCLAFTKEPSAYTRKRQQQLQAMVAAYRQEIVNKIENDDLKNRDLLDELMDFDTYAKGVTRDEKLQEFAGDVARNWVSQRGLLLAFSDTANVLEITAHFNRETGVIIHQARLYICTGDPRADFFGVLLHTKQAHNVADSKVDHMGHYEIIGVMSDDGPVWRFPHDHGLIQLVRDTMATHARSNLHILAVPIGTSEDSDVEQLPSRSKPPDAGKPDATAAGQAAGQGLAAPVSAVLVPGSDGKEVPLAVGFVANGSAHVREIIRAVSGNFRLNGQPELGARIQRWRMRCSRYGKPQFSKSQQAKKFDPISTRSKRCGCDYSLLWMPIKRVPKHAWETAQQQDENDHQPATGQRQKTHGPAVGELRERLIHGQWILKKWSRTHTKGCVPSALQKKQANRAAGRSLPQDVFRQVALDVERGVRHDTIFRTLCFKAGRLGWTPTKKYVWNLLYRLELLKKQHRLRDVAKLPLSPLTDDELHEVLAHVIHNASTQSVCQATAVLATLHKIITGFQYRTSQTDEGFTKALVWMYPRQLHRASQCEVVQMDGAQGLNDANYPYVIICHLDHFGKIRVIAQALVRVEESTSLAWVWAQVKDMCPEFDPSVLFTDGVLLSASQVDAIRGASDLKLFLCCHHIIDRDVPRRVSLSSLSSIKTMFWKMAKCSSEDEFERLWKDMQQQHPTSIKEIHRWYQRRERWGGPWRKSVFSNSRSSTSWAESTAGAVKQWTRDLYDKGCPGMAGVIQATLRREMEQEEDEHKREYDSCSEVLPAGIGPKDAPELQLLKQLWLTHSWWMVKQLGEEMVQSYAYDVNQVANSDPGTKFAVSRRNTDADARFIDVTLLNNGKLVADADLRALCSCLGITWKGYICRHLLAYARKHLSKDEFFALIVDCTLDYFRAWHVHVEDSIQAKLSCTEFSVGADKKFEIGIQLDLSPATDPIDVGTGTGVGASEADDLVVPSNASGAYSFICNQTPKLAGLIVANKGLREDYMKMMAHIMKRVKEDEIARTGRLKQLVLEHIHDHNEPRSYRRVVHEEKQRERQRARAGGVHVEDSDSGSDTGQAKLQSVPGKRRKRGKGDKSSNPKSKLMKKQMRPNGKRKQAVKQAIDNTSSGSDAESAGVNNVGQSGTISFKGRELDIKMPANRGPVSSQPKRRFHSLGSRKKPGWETRRAKRKRASVGAKKGFKCGFCHTPGHKLPSCQNIHKIGDLININELGSVEEINPNTAKVTAVDAHSTSIPTRHVPALLVCARSGSGKDMLLQVKTLGKWDPAKQTCPVSSTLWVSQATIRQWLTKGRRLFKIRSKPEISEWYDEKEFFNANGLLRKEVHVTRKGCHSKLTKQHVCYEIDWVDYKASWNDEAYCKHWFPDWVSQFGPNND